MKKKLYEFRGSKVLLDADLAEVYGYELKAFNQQVKRNIERFQNMEVVGEYFDEGHSGKNIKGRQEFMWMLNDIEDGSDRVDLVLVFKLSRFGRNAADVRSSLQLMQDYGVNLICVEDVRIPLERNSQFVIAGRLSAPNGKFY